MDGDGVSAPQVAASHYTFTNYATKGRWASYWHQIDEVLRLRPQQCLVVGVGDSVVLDALRSAVEDVVSLDIDSALRPTYVGSVTAIPLPSQSVDVVLCAQVLEHLPYEQFEGALRELARVSRHGLVLSLPRLSRAWSVRVGPIRRRDRIVALTIPLQRRLPPNDQHYWEVDAKGYPIRRVRQTLRSVGRIAREYRVPEHPYHHFWVVRFGESTGGA